tara:strand:+ start:5358 stop:5783 length:426 start_codon:yes stop_codon:yes gene_type:complete
MATSPDQSAHFQGFYNRSPGITSVGSYQVAGKPFLTGSVVANLAEVQIDFPNVTKSITVINKDASGNDAIRVHFVPQAQATPNFNFITLDAKNSSVTLNVKATSIYISNDSGNSSNFELFAELTGIGPGAMFALTGPGIDA